MSSSKITVYRNGSPLAGAKVTLEFSGFTNMGFTKPSFSDQNGVAMINHSSSGQASIYVNGRREGSVYAPGAESIYL